MTAKTTEKQAVSNMLIGRWEQTGAKLASLAETFPEEQYELSPVAGVRTFADVLRHVAFWNRYVADMASGRKADDSTNEFPKSEYPTKEKILSVLTRTSADATAALQQMREGLGPDSAALVESFIEHTCEHYGQLVVYARWAGVVPPVSRA
jgi:uncharacterized damage-inducible protein DinB